MTSLFCYKVNYWKVSGTLSPVIFFFFFTCQIIYAVFVCEFWFVGTSKNITYSPCPTAWLTLCAIFFFAFYKLLFINQVCKVITIPQQFKVLCKHIFSSSSCQFLIRNFFSSRLSGHDFPDSKYLYLTLVWM